MNTSPPKHDNAPGLSELSYRVGKHPDFFRRMLTRLRTQEAPSGKRPLAALTGADTTDPTIAFLDAWATVADVLTFYQERIANEGYLRTATSRRSVLEMTRAIGYELQPGLAASTYLAFTVEDAVDATAVVTVPKGTQVQSIPQETGQMPQTFETSEELTARAEWNALTPQLTRAQGVTIESDGENAALLKGTDTQLQTADAVLLVDPENSANWHFGVIQTVEAHLADDYTRVTWQKTAESASNVALSNPTIIALRQRASLFGYNAPDWRTMPTDIKNAYGETETDEGTETDDGTARTNWANFQMQGIIENNVRIGNLIDLDRTYPEIMPGGWLVLVSGEVVKPLGTRAVSTISRADFTLTAQVTRIEPESEDDLCSFGLRETAVFVQSEELPSIEPSELPDEHIPISDPVGGDTVVLDQVVPELPSAHPLIFTGTAVASGETVSEVAFVSGASDDTERATITLREPLENSYDR
ncbi:MAG: putative baseplate assembly protein, partial [Candidatus Poribacteria bacterium]|nr:putative baseplate assembly protein [Candidatus Poribacteria bacterium]